MSKLTLYFDRCVGRRLPEMVERLDPPFDVRHHKGEGFAPDMPDDEWLAIVGAKKWIVISHDGKWHREEGPLMAIQQHRIPCFYIWGAQMPMWNKIALLTKVFSTIKETVASEKRPFIYNFNQAGRRYLVRHWDGRTEPKKYTRLKPKFHASG